MSTLVIAAHPDDEVLGCGGTMARLSAVGEKVTIAILGEGITSRSDQREKAATAELDALRLHAFAAAAKVGVEDVRLFGLPDNRFDTVPVLDVVKVIERLIHELQPHTVYTQHGGDLNIDHVVTFRATMTATRPMEGHPVRRLYAYEVGSSTEWAFQQFSPPFRPDTFVDISATIEQKIAAMQVYESESRIFPHPRAPEALRAQAARWGATAGLHAAEAFQSIRILQ